MGLWDMIAVVVIVGVGGGVLTEYFKTKRMQPNDDAASKAKDERIEKLEARVATLERILTDGKDALKKEIDAL